MYQFYGDHPNDQMLDEDQIIPRGLHDNMEGPPNLASTSPPSEEDQKKSPVVKPTNIFQLPLPPPPPAVALRNAAKLKASQHGTRTSSRLQNINAKATDLKKKTLQWRERSPHYQSAVNAQFAHLPNRYTTFWPPPPTHRPTAEMISAFIGRVNSWGRSKNPGPSMVQVTLPAAKNTSVKVDDNKSIAQAATNQKFGGQISTNQETGNVNKNQQNGKNGQRQGKKPQIITEDGNAGGVEQPEDKSNQKKKSPDKKSQGVVESQVKSVDIINENLQEIEMIEKGEDVGEGKKNQNDKNIDQNDKNSPQDGGDNSEDIPQQHEDGNGNVNQQEGKGPKRRHRNRGKKGPKEDEMEKKGPEEVRRVWKTASNYTSPLFSGGELYKLVDIPIHIPASIWTAFAALLTAHLQQQPPNDEKVPTKKGQPAQTQPPSDDLVSEELIYHVDQVVMRGVDPDVEPPRVADPKLVIQFDFRSGEFTATDTEFKSHVVIPPNPLSIMW